MSIKDEDTPHYHGHRDRYANRDCDLDRHQVIRLQGVAAAAVPEPLAALRGSPAFDLHAANATSAIVMIRCGARAIPSSTPAGGDPYALDELIEDA